MRIEIKGVEVFAHHGVLPEEKLNGQRFIIDASLELAEGLPAGDEITSTVDYASIAESIVSVATSERFNLIESLASRIASFLVRQTGVIAAEVTVKKPDAPIPVPVEYVAATATIRAVDNDHPGDGAGLRKETE